MTTFNFNTLCAGRSLTTEESQALFTQVFEGKIDPALLAGILTALKIKGETPEEIEGAARAGGCSSSLPASAGSGSRGNRRYRRRWDENDQRFNYNSASGCRSGTQDC